MTIKMHRLKCGAFFFVGIGMIRTAKDGGDEVIFTTAKLPFSENFFSPSVSFADSSLVRGSLLMLP